MELATIEELSPALTKAAEDMGLEIQIQRGTANGWGLVDVPIVDVSVPGGLPIRVWEEGRGDYRFEMGELDAVWWGQRRTKQVRLPMVILSLAQGRYEASTRGVLVMLGGRRQVMLRDRL